MRFFSTRLVVSALLVASLAASVFADEDDIPLRNWTIPPYHGASTNGITTMTDVTPGTALVGILPCRLVDTRTGAFPAGYGPPSLAAGAPRNFDLNSDPQCPGIPVGVSAYSLNITVTNTLGAGFILIFPQGGPQPPVSTLNYVAGQTVANAAIVPAGTGGGVTVIAGVSGTDLIIDINGYFTDFYNVGNAFSVITTAPGTAAVFAQNFSTAAGAYGVYGETSSNTAGGGAGVWGANAGAIGAGVYGTHGAAGAGVWGIAFGTSGSNSRGVIGDSKSTTVGAIGVEGIAANATAGIYGVFSNGNMGATGTKPFVEPHPTDPTKVIRYVALEGNEVGTYFRGRAKFQNKLARIPVPEDFRIVTADDGLTVQITPIGAMASVAVLKMDLNEITVTASRDVEFSYLVQGVRRAFRDHQPIADGLEFLPASAHAEIPGYLTSEARARLISNGTYNSDGTVNMETARKLGWIQIWADREDTLPAIPRHE
jgi:hypothetical protein